MNQHEIVNKYRKCLILALIIPIFLLIPFFFNLRDPDGTKDIVNPGQYSDHRNVHQHLLHISNTIQIIAIGY